MTRGKMRLKTSYGPELELLLVNKNDGSVDCDADRILKTVENPFVYKEFVSNWIEVGAQHSPDLEVMARSLVGNLRYVVDSSAPHGVIPLPVGTSVSNDFPSSRRDKSPSATKKIRSSILSDGWGYVEHCLGLHCHVDAGHSPGKVLKQMQLITGLDLLTTVTASMPFFYGTHNGNDPRTLFYRKCLTPAASGVKALNPYPTSIKGFEEDLQRLYETMTMLANRKGLPHDERIADSMYRNISGPIRRVIEDGGRNTIEHRAADSTLPSYAMAYFALLKTFNEYVLRDDVQVRIDGELDNSYTIDPQGRLVLPRFGLLKKLEPVKAKRGMGSPEIAKWVGNMYETALGLIDPVDEKYLGPVQGMVEDRRNLSDLIAYTAKSNGMLDGRELREGAEKDLRLAYGQELMRDLDLMERRLSQRTKSEYGPIPQDDKVYSRVRP